MINLELTIEQKDKLLQMCKVLFPEYTENKNHEWRLFRGHIDFVNFANWEFLIHIHWFEFCCTRLIPKLGLGDTPINILLQNNLVDFLYEEFIRLKKNKLI